MKNLIITVFIFWFGTAFSQENDSIPKVENDSLPRIIFELEEIVVTDSGVYTMSELEKQKLILKRRVYRVYPYAKAAAEKLTAMNETMSQLKTQREKKKYFKIVENYLTDEFEAKLKKLSMKDGQILVKLINRQTGKNTFELIKDLKSGWKAFWANSTAKLFNINLKTEYKPYDVLEDFNIESILITAFNSGYLARQEAQVPIDLEKLLTTWEKSNAESKALREAKEED